MNIDMLHADFREIFVHEERAKAFYGHYAEQVEDPEIRKVLYSIAEEEKGHMKLARELMKMCDDERTT
ncbi:MAG: hypothetical protein GF408_06220 [Candidatus Omnitrophica bacterium]|nr:hypothetical protein [Candidatus Omnitrophota bacterium]